MKKLSAMLMSAAALAVLVSTAPAAEKEANKVLDLEMKAIDGKSVELADKYDGKVVLVVNVASKCGLTPQYGGLQQLHDKYADKGLVVAGFPCNQFAGQEPGSEAEISQFCKQNYGVSFDLFSKIEVNGDGQCELYERLTSEDAGAKFPGKIKWNFEKFLINRDGEVVARFDPPVKPESEEVVTAIEAELSK